MVERLLDRAEKTDDATEAKEALQRLADIYEHDMGDREAAFTVLQAAIARDPTDRLTLRELDRVGAALGKWAELLDVYTDAVAGLESKSAEAACEIWTRIARLYTQQIPSLEHAEHAITMALRLDPEHFEVLAAQAEIQRRRGQWHLFVDTLRRQLAVTRDPSVKIDLHLA